MEIAAVPLVLAAAGKLLKCLTNMKASMSKADHLVLELEISVKCYRTQVDGFQKSHGHRVIRPLFNEDLYTFSRLLDNASDICQKVSSESTMALFLKAWYKYVPMLKFAGDQLDSMWQKHIKDYCSGKLDHMFEEPCAPDEGIKAFVPALAAAPSPSQQRLQDAAAAARRQQDAAAAARRQQDAAAAEAHRQEQARSQKLLREAEAALKAAQDALKTSESKQSATASPPKAKSSACKALDADDKRALKRIDVVQAVDNNSDQTIAASVIIARILTGLSREDAIPFIEMLESRKFATLISTKLKSVRSFNSDVTKYMICNYRVFRQSLFDIFQASMERCFDELEDIHGDYFDQVWI